METTFNRTKIVSTLGPASSAPEVLREMFNAGVDVCRLNASHGSHEDHQRLINLIKNINAESDSHVSILLDLQGPKIRIGDLEKPYPIAPGEEVVLSTAIRSQEGQKIPMVYPTFAKDVRVGDLVLVEDGKVELRVLETNGEDTVRLKVLSGSAIGRRKGVNLPTTPVSLPSLTEKDREDLDFGLSNDVEWIALSFVRKASDVQELKELIKAKGSTAKVIAKIEKPEALKNIDAIIDAADAVMVARGDLGVEIPIEEVPFWQKRIVRKCNAVGRPVIVATQMLESMIENARPTRAESTDVANAVLDGADAVMVSGETSVGKYPVEVVRMLNRIIGQAEMEESLYRPETKLDPASPRFLSDAICLTACRLARGVKAQALVSMTRSGYTAFQLSRHRPPAPIFIFTDNPRLLNTLSLVWGVRTFYYDRFVGTNETIRDVIQILKEKGHLRTGDVVVNTASMPLSEKGRTNLVKISIVDEPLAWAQ